MQFLLLMERLQYVVFNELPDFSLHANRIEIIVSLFEICKLSNYLRCVVGIWMSFCMQRYFI